MESGKYFFRLEALDYLTSEIDLDLSYLDFDHLMTDNEIKDADDLGGVRMINKEDRSVNLYEPVIYIDRLITELKKLKSEGATHVGIGAEGSLVFLDSYAVERLSADDCKEYLKNEAELLKKQKEDRIVRLERELKKLKEEV